MVPPTCRWNLHNLGRLEKVNIVFNFLTEKPLMKPYPGLIWTLLTLVEGERLDRGRFTFLFL